MQTWGSPASMVSWKKSFLGKPSYIYPTDPQTDQLDCEFDEADVWNDCAYTNDHPDQIFAGASLETKKSMIISRSALTKLAKKGNPIASASLPVNIPDWSKILKEDYRDHKRESDEEVDDGGEGEYSREGIKIPPHEYLAMTRGSSFSVHEGIGRTLKGRDLRRVRNAVWKKVGFED